MRLRPEEERYALGRSAARTLEGVLDLMYSDEIITGDDIETRPLLDDSYILAGSTLCGGRSYALLADFFLAFAEELGVDNIDIYGVLDGIAEEMYTRYQTSVAGSVFFSKIYKKSC